MVGNDGTIYVSSELRTKNKEFDTFVIKEKKNFWWFILAIRRLWFIKFAFIKSLKSWLADFREEFSYWIMKFL